MTTIQSCDVTALFDVCWKTNKRLNPMRVRNFIMEKSTGADDDEAMFGLMEQREATRGDQG